MNAHYQLIYQRCIFYLDINQANLQKMKKILPIAVVAGFSIFTYSAIAGKTRQNRQIVQNDSIAQMKAYQLAYNNQIKPTLKSGDHLFIKYDFEKAFTVRQYLWGLWQRLWADEPVDSIGFIYKNNNGVYVLFSQFGEQKVLPFDEFTMMMYLDGVFYQENWRKDFDFQSKLAEIVEKTKGQVRAQNIRQSAIDFLNRINFTMYGAKNYETCFKFSHLLTTKSPKLKNIEILSTRVFKRITELQMLAKRQQEVKEKK